MKKNIVIALLLISGALSAQKAEVFQSSGQAIHGYDAVAYFAQHKALKGDKNFKFQWRGADWYFASKQDLDLFAKSPEQYAPQYGGYCAYGLSEGHKAPTDPDAWTIVDGKLYLNYSTDVRAKWREDEKERIDKADKNWPDLKDKE
jgi:YHS domain-containing protein